MSGFLLDTCAFIWLADGSSALSRPAHKAVYSGETVYLSAASALEISTKYAGGRLPLPARPDQLVPTLREDYGFAALPVDEESAIRSGLLPPIHRDPFDRMLVAQALTHGLTVITPDTQIFRYGVRTLW